MKFDGRVFRHSPVVFREDYGYTVNKAYTYPLMKNYLLQTLVTRWLHNTGTICKIKKKFKKSATQVNSVADMGLNVDNDMYRCIEDQIS